jgi:4'-phosphopantetheinyl transferase
MAWRLSGLYSAHGFNYGSLIVFKSLSHDASVLTLYFCALEEQSLNEQQLQILRGWLPKDEEAKADRFLQADARHKGLLVRGYLRGVLSLYARKIGFEIAPSEWQFDYLEKGKPVLSDTCFARCPLQFNISHSGERLLVAVTQGNRGLQLGVDIERLRISTHIYPILTHYFTPDETLNLLALPEVLHRARFFDLWALKESYIKAKGLGLALSLKSFSFTFDSVIARNQQGERMDSLQIDSQQYAELNSNIALFLHDENLKKQAANWQVILGHLDDEYRFAISMEREEALTLVGAKIDMAQLL